MDDFVEFEGLSRIRRGAVGVQEEVAIGFKCRRKLFGEAI